VTPSAVSSGYYAVSQVSCQHVRINGINGRAYLHRIPLARLKCVSEKLVRELAGRLLKSREAGDRDYNPQPCLLPTSLWCEK
jgi:hypothetical protein